MDLWWILDGYFIDIRNFIYSSCRWIVHLWESKSNSTVVWDSRLARITPQEWQPPRGCHKSNHLFWQQIGENRCWSVRSTSINSCNYGKSLLSQGKQSTFLINLLVLCWFGGSLHSASADASWRDITSAPARVVSCQPSPGSRTEGSGSQDPWKVNIKWVVNNGSQVLVQGSDTIWFTAHATRLW